MRQITVFTHRHPEEIAEAIAELLAQAAGGRRDAALRPGGDRQARPGAGARARPGRADRARRRARVALGGDGTILRALQHYAGTGVPVFGINYGEIGFLATVEPDDLAGGVARALSGEFELLRLPAIAVELPGRRLAARDERPGDHPQSRRPRRRAVLLARQRGGRPRALRRARRRDARRLDGLQPRQRRARDGLGRGGPRRLVHRAALDDGPGARRRAGRPHHDPQRLARAARRRVDGRPGRRSSRRDATDPRPASSEISARSPSCPGRPSTGACARSSGASRAERRGAQATCASPCRCAPARPGRPGSST